MKLVIHQKDGPPITVEGDRVRLQNGDDAYEVRGVHDGSLSIRLEEHADRIALHLAVFPTGANGIRIKGGLR